MQWEGERNDNFEFHLIEAKEENLNVVNCNGYVGKWYESESANFLLKLQNT